MEVEVDTSPVTLPTTAHNAYIDTVTPTFNHPKDWPAGTMEVVVRLLMNLTQLSII